MSHLNGFSVRAHARLSLRACARTHRHVACRRQSALSRARSCFLPGPVREFSMNRGTVHLPTHVSRRTSRNDRSHPPFPRRGSSSAEAISRWNPLRDFEQSGTRGLPSTLPPLPYIYTPHTYRHIYFFSSLRRQVHDPGNPSADRRPRVSSARTGRRVKPVPRERAAVLETGFRRIDRLWIWTRS